MLQSKATLFEVVDVDEVKRVLTLNDILSEVNEPVKIMDMSLSGSVKIGAIIYTRVVDLGEFSMTTGLGFIFSSDHKAYIMNRSRKMLKKLNSGDSSVDYFTTYFHLNRSDGVLMRFEQVE